MTHAERLLRILEDAPDVSSIVQEVLSALGYDVPVPEIKIVNAPRARYLGQCIWKTGGIGGGHRPEDSWCADNTVIEIQKSILGQERTLRRVLAHELCHHVDNLVFEKVEFKRLGFQTYKMLNRRNSGHGKHWRELAATINAKYGQDFVTERSDATHIEDAIEVREFFILLWRPSLENYGLPKDHPSYNQLDKIYYSVASRLGPKATKYVSRHTSDEYRIAKTKDSTFIKGASIGGGWSESKDQEKMRGMWDQAKPLTTISESITFLSVDYKTGPDYVHLSNRDASVILDILGVKKEWAGYSKGKMASSEFLKRLRVGRSRFEASPQEFVREPGPTTVVGIPLQDYGQSVEDLRKTLDHLERIAAKAPRGMEWD